MLSDKQQKLEILEVLKPENIKETCPVLLIGRAVYLFKNMYKGGIIELKNTDDVKEFVSEFTGIKSSKPVVISDLGYLQRTSLFLLLKLVEEAKFPIILLSTEDKVDSILLSRIKRVVKFPINNRTNNKLISINTAFEEIYSEDSKVVNKMEYYAENCPQMYSLEYKVPYSRSRNRMIKLLGDLE